MVKSIYISDETWFPVDEEFCNRILSSPFQIDYKCISSLLLSDQVVLNISCDFYDSLVPPCSTWWQVPSVGFIIK